MSTTILQTLRAEHDVLRQLCDLISETKGGTGTREQLWYRLKSELLCHAEAEEEALYDLLATMPPTKELAEHSVEEHDAIDEVVEQLDHIGFDQPAWKTTFDRLVHLSNHHLDEEEVELFPVAGKYLDEARKVSATAHYRRAKIAAEKCMRDRLLSTTEKGVDERTYESRTLEALRRLGRSRGLKGAGEADRSTLISKLRGAPKTDA